ncbi:cell envelope integrity protein TolA [Kangiella shandongensis]
MSNKKNILPIVISIVLHLALIMVLIWKFIWQPNIPEHKYVDAPIQARIAQAPKNNPPPPKVDKAKLEQERLEKQRKEQERLKKLQREKELAEQKAREKAEAERKAKEQAELERKKKLALEKKKEEERKKKEEAERKRLEEEKRKKAEAERKRKEEEARKKKLAEEKRKKAEAERKRKEEEERKRQEELERLQKELEAQESEFYDAMEGDVKKAQALTELEELKVRIRDKLARLWNMPSTPGSCTITIKTAPGGVVLDTIVVGGDEAYCQTGISAINRAAPLPYSENPEVIKELRSIRFTFDPTLKD